jgi:hypothetical protein
VAGVAEDLGVVDLQAPVGSDVDGEDVVYEVRCADDAYFQAVLAEVVIKFPALEGYSFPIAVVAPLFGGAAVAVVVPAGDGQVLVAVALACGAWAAGVAAALLKLHGHGALP